MPPTLHKTLRAKKSLVIAAVALPLAAALVVTLALTSKHGSTEPRAFCWGQLSRRDLGQLSTGKGGGYSAEDEPRAYYSGYQKRKFPLCNISQGSAWLAEISVRPSLHNSPWGSDGLDRRAVYESAAPMPHGITGWTGIPHKPQWPSAQLLLPEACRKPFRTGDSDVQLRVILRNRQEERWSDTSTRERMTHIATKVADHLTRKYKCGDENWQKKGQGATPTSKFEHVDPANVCRLRDLKVFTEPEAAEQVRQRTAGTIEDTWSCVTVLDKRLQEQTSTDTGATLAAFTTTRNPHHLTEFKEAHGSSTSGKGFTARIVRCGSREYLLNAKYPVPDKSDAGKFGEKNLLDGDTLYTDFEKAFKQRAQCGG